MRAAHLPDVVWIEGASFALPWSRESFAGEMENPLSFSWVATEGGKARGYLVAGRLMGEGHILKIAVHPAWRRRGMARALTETALGRLKEEGCERVYLEVRESNRAAVELYRSYGFQAVGKRKFYYPPAMEDAVVMELRMR